MAGGQFYKVPTDTFQTLVMDAGIVTDDFTPATGEIGNILGATTGGLTFNTNPTYEDFGEDVDNIPPNTWQMKRIVSYDPALSGTYVTVTAALAAALSGAGAFATGDATHFVPSHELVEDDFVDIWFIANYSDKNQGAATAGYVAIHLKNAMNTSGFQVTTQKAGKGQFAFEYHGHYDLTDPDDVPFEFYVKAGTSGTLASLTVTSEAGTESGDSKITVSGYTLGTGESYVYSTAADTAPTVTYGQSVSAWTALTSGDDITPASGHNKITVAVKNASGKAVGSGTATITVNS